MRILLGLLLFLLVVAGGAWLVAGRADGPAIDIRQPTKLVGQNGRLDVQVNAPAGNLTRLDVAIEQNGKTIPLFSLPGTEGAELKQAGQDVVQVTRPIGRRSVPDLRQGNARIVVRAERPVLFGLRTAASEATRDVEVRFTPPRIGVVSLHHFVNHGGSEMVVYSVQPANAESGVRVGEISYPGYPAADAGVRGADPSLKVAFFAVLHDQDLNTPVNIFARDEAGNEATASFDYRVNPKVFRKSRIELDDPFLQRVVPAILDNTPDLQVENPDDRLGSFLKINGELRQRNARQIIEISRKTSPRRLWDGPFRQLTNSQVEAGFADYRTYIYQGKEVDRQVHLGFDLAVTAAIPVEAANRGTVAFADYLGIYGNCVIVDHGMGLQSLYAHLSTIEVKPGDTVQQGQRLGRSGMTGLAGGDHLHFTTLLHGHPVTPVDWWSGQWVEDRILRKLREASTPEPTAQATPTAATAAAN